MNNFNTVFLAVKKYCGDKGVTEDSSCFEAISKATKIPLNRLDFYLTTLQDLGLIKYSITDGYIKLTAFGKKQERLFTE